MERKVGTVSRGIRYPTVREGDNLAEIVVNSVLETGADEGFKIRDRDVISVVESVAARAQRNYASIQAISEDMKAKLRGDTIGVIFPILSRNRFSICLKEITGGAKKIVFMFSYPSDGVGDPLVSLDQVNETGISPYSDVLILERYRELFEENRHEFTGVDYVDYCRQIIRETRTETEVTFANNPREILSHIKRVPTCDIHSRVRTKCIPREAGAEVVHGMDDVLNAPVNGNGCGERHGLLGSDKSTEDSIRLSSRECMDLVLDIQKQIFDKVGKHVEVMVYNDRVFKNPIGKTWELADPRAVVVNTEGLEGAPNEVKLKYLADNDFKDLSGEALESAISWRIKEKRSNLVGDMSSQGTTPERLMDLIESLCDPTSGSGDKGTPVILVQGYFDNYTDWSSVPQQCEQLQQSCTGRIGGAVSA